MCYKKDPLVQVAFVESIKLWPYYGSMLLDSIELKLSFYFVYAQKTIVLRLAESRVAEWAILPNVCYAE